MALENTLGILKPDCIRKNLIGAVLERIEQAGFKICGLRMVVLSQRDARAFYAIHQERFWFEDLVSFMTSGPVVVMALQKDNAVKDFRALIGATDPGEAAEGTIRRAYAESRAENIVHGSDSVENGKMEVDFFFARYELS